MGTQTMIDYEAIAQRIEAEVSAAAPGPWWIGGDTDDEGTKLLARQGTPFDSPHDPEVEWVATFYDTGPSGHGPNLALAASAPQRALALAACVRALALEHNLMADHECKPDERRFYTKTCSALAAIRDSEETP